MAKNPQTYGNLSYRNSEDVRYSTATNGQTGFNVNYSVGFVTVYQNGRRLNASDYTATNGTSITLAVGATTGDEIICIGKVAFTIPNTMTLSAGGTTAGPLKTSSPTAGLGYATGAGGSVTQSGSKSATVVLNKLAGRITMHNANITANTSVSFTLTNSTIEATDVVLVSIASGATAGYYQVTVDAVNSGNCQISLHNSTAVGQAEAVVLNFIVIKSVIT